MSHPAVVNKINPGMYDEILTVYSKNLYPQECEKMTQHILNGRESYDQVSESEVVKAVDTYLKEQNKINKRG